jgi:hypothetical protein
MRGAQHGVAVSVCKFYKKHLPQRLSTVVVVVVNIFIPSWSSHAGMFPDLLMGPPFHYLSSLIRRVGSSLLPPPSLEVPRGVPLKGVGVLG